MTTEQIADYLELKEYPVTTPYKVRDDGKIKMYTGLKGAYLIEATIICVNHELCRLHDTDEITEEYLDLIIGFRKKNLEK